MGHRDAIHWFGLIKEAVVITIAIAPWIVMWYRKRSAIHWPITYGTVEFGISTDTDNKWRADLSYSYKAGSEFYSGQISLPAKDEDDAHEKISRWKDQTLIVRYSPNHPDVSMVRPEDQRSWLTSDLKPARVLIR